MLKSKIALTEEEGQLVLDVTDDTGGLGLKLYFTPAEATRLGQGLLDRARFAVSSGRGDPKRIGTQEFTGEREAGE